MKTTLKISLVLNLLLLGGFVYAWLAQRSPQTVHELPAVISPVVTATASTTEIPPVIRQTEPSPFRWSQLASPDYHEYVGNLRKIGCPEATLRAIVTADEDVKYRRKSQELEQKLDATSTSSWSVQLSTYQQQQDLKAQLMRLPREEYLEICDLLGLQPASERQPALAGTGTATGRPAIARKAAVMPLVLKPVNYAELGLNEQQIQAINELREQFVDEIGGPNQDPSDPAYRERWQMAQPEMDDNLRGMLGITVFENYQLVAQSPPPSGN